MNTLTICKLSRSLGWQLQNLSLPRVPAPPAGLHVLCVWLPLPLPKIPKAQGSQWELGNLGCLDQATQKTKSQKNTTGLEQFKITDTSSQKDY